MKHSKKNQAKENVNWKEQGEKHITYEKAPTFFFRAWGNKRRLSTVKEVFL